MSAGGLRAAGHLCATRASVRSPMETWPANVSFDSRLLQLEAKVELGRKGPEIRRQWRRRH